MKFSKNQRWPCWAREGLPILSALVQLELEHSFCLGLEHLCLYKISTLVTLLYASNVRYRLGKQEQGWQVPVQEGHYPTGFSDLPGRQYFPPWVPHLPWWKRTEKLAGCSPWALGLDTQSITGNSPPLWRFCITVLICSTPHLTRPFSFPSFSIKDTSNPEDQSSWDSFKNMTPELSIVPGEQKDRMELHNKNWDSSSANTPDSSEGDFQTEVWGRTDVQLLTDTLARSHWGTRPRWTPQRLYMSEFLQRFSHTLLPVSTDALRQIRYCICLPPQRADAEKGDCSTIYFSQQKTIET